MKNSLRTYFLNIVEPGPLTLSLGLLFLICYMNKISNGFLIFLYIVFLFLKCELPVIYMINTVNDVVNRVNNKIKVREYVSIKSYNQPKNKNTYYSHIRQQNAYKDLETGYLYITEISITHAEITKGIKNIHVGINENELAFIPLNKLKVYQLTNEKEKNDFLNLLKEKDYSRMLEQQISNEKMTEVITNLLKQDGYNIENTPLVSGNSTLEDYVSVIQATNLVGINNQD